MQGFFNELCINSLYLKITESNNGKSIVQNALKEASKQGAIAIISDNRLDKELIEKTIESRSNGIFKGNFYTKKEIIYLVKGNLILIDTKTGGR